MSGLWTSCDKNDIIDTCPTPWNGKSFDYIEFDITNKRVMILDEFAIEDIHNGYTDEIESYEIGELMVSFLEKDFKKFDHPYFYTSVDTGFHPSHDNEELIQNIKKTLIALSSSNCSLADLWAHDDLIEISGYFSAVFNISPLREIPYCKIEVQHETKKVVKHSIGIRYINTSPLSFCITELFKSLETNVKFKVCKNCGKLFVVNSNRNIEYCDRIYKDTGLTCKKIGATKQYKAKVNNNPILKEYNKAYKRNYARIGKPGMTNSDFSAWVEESKIQRDKASYEYLLTGNQKIIENFKKYLGNR